MGMAEGRCWNGRLWRRLGRCLPAGLRCGGLARCPRPLAAGSAVLRVAEAPGVPGPGWCFDGRRWHCRWQGLQLRLSRNRRWLLVTAVRTGRA